MRNPASEEQLWSYLIQLTATLRNVHSAGLALRPAALAPSKVPCTWSCCAALKQRAICRSRDEEQ
jgi:hypothetical protein